MYIDTGAILSLQNGLVEPPARPRGRSLRASTSRSTSARSRNSAIARRDRPATPNPCSPARTSPRGPPRTSPRRARPCTITSSKSDPRRSSRRPAKSDDGTTRTRTRTRTRTGGARTPPPPTRASRRRRRSRTPPPRVRATRGTSPRSRPGARRPRGETPCVRTTRGSSGNPIPMRSPPWTRRRRRGATFRARESPTSGRASPGAAEGATRARLRRA